MAYDETLAARIREVIGDNDGEVTEREMFGGLAFMLNGRMFAGAAGGELMPRLGDAGAEAALRREHVREMDVTARPRCVKGSGDPCPAPAPAGDAAVKDRRSVRCQQAG